MKNIPYKLTFLFPKNCKISGNYLTCFPFDSKKKKSYERKIKTFYISNTCGKDFEEIEVINSGFTLGILRSFESENAYHLQNSSFGSSGLCVRLSISHPDFPVLDKKICVLVPVGDFMIALDKSGYISDGALHGTFCLGLNLGISSVTLELEDKNSDLEKEKEAGKLLSTTRKTSKWIPGHKYLLPSREVLVYLGRAEKILSHKFYSSKNIKSLFSSLALGMSMYEVMNDSVPVFLLLDLKRDYSTYGKTIPQFLKSTLTESVDNTDPNNIDVLDFQGIFSNKIPGAVDLGKFLDEPDGYNFSEDLKLQIYNFLKLHNFPEIPQPNLYSNCCEASALYSGITDKFQDIPEIVESLSKNMEKYIKNAISECIRGRRYYISRDSSIKRGISVSQFKSYLINENIMPYWILGTTKKCSWLVSEVDQGIVDEALKEELIQLFP